MLTPRTNSGIQTNDLGPDQAAPRGAVWSGFTLLTTDAFQKSQQTTLSSFYGDVVEIILDVNNSSSRKEILRNIGIYYCGAVIYGRNGDDDLSGLDETYRRSLFPW